MLVVIMVAADSKVQTSNGYIIGAVIAILLFCYLVYTLIKPEKF